MFFEMLTHKGIKGGEKGAKEIIFGCVCGAGSGEEVLAVMAMGGGGVMVRVC